MCRFKQVKYLLSSKPDIKENDIDTDEYSEAINFSNPLLINYYTSNTIQSQIKNI